MADLNSATVFTALVGIVGGGVGLETVRYWLNRPKQQVDIASEVRDELREDIVRLRANLTVVERELDEWKANYYQLLSEAVKGKVELAKALERINQQDEIE